MQNLILTVLSCYLSSKFRYLQFQILHIFVLASTEQRAYDVFTISVGWNTKTCRDPKPWTVPGPPKTLLIKSTINFHNGFQLWKKIYISDYKLKIIQQNVLIIFPERVFKITVTIVDATEADSGLGTCESVSFKQRTTRAKCLENSDAAHSPAMFLQPL